MAAGGNLVRAAVAIAALLAAACTPGYTGACKADAQCKSDEFCAQGLCLKRGTGSALDAVLPGNSAAMSSRGYRLTGTLGGTAHGPAGDVGHELRLGAAPSPRARR
ncbi:MAG: hypothetical protein NVSMB23_21820 [Myxococcales bacterium]